MNSVKKAANDTAASGKIERAALRFLEKLWFFTGNLPIFVRFVLGSAVSAMQNKPRLTIRALQRRIIPEAADDPKSVKLRLTCR